MAWPFVPFIARPAPPPQAPAAPAPPPPAIPARPPPLAIALALPASPPPVAPAPVQVPHGVLHGKGGIPAHLPPDVLVQATEGSGQFSDFYVDQFGRKRFFCRKREGNWVDANGDLDSVDIDALPDAWKQKYKYYANEVSARPAYEAQVNDIARKFVWLNPDLGDWSDAAESASRASSKTGHKKLVMLLTDGYRNHFPELRSRRARKRIEDSATKEPPRTRSSSATYKPPSPILCGPRTARPNRGGGGPSRSPKRKYGTPGRPSNETRARFDAQEKMMAELEELEERAARAQATLAGFFPPEQIPPFSAYPSLSSSLDDRSRLMDSVAAETFSPSSYAETLTACELESPLDEIAASFSDAGSPPLPLDELLDLDMNWDRPFAAEGAMMRSDSGCSLSGSGWFAMPPPCDELRSDDSAYNMMVSEYILM